MPSAYPGALDSLPTSSANDTASLDTHPALHNDANAAINAVQTELGTTPSGTRSTVKARLESIDITQLACSDETTALTTGVKAVFRLVGARTLVGVRASLKTAQASGSILTVDVKKNGSSVLSTLLTIDNTEKTSTTAATAAVISATAGVADFSDDAEVSIEITQVGDGTAAGLKVALLWG